jgi:hypothetical protein
MSHVIKEIPDKLGVYRLGDLKVYSKLEAIEIHKKTKIHPIWDFNEAVFSSYDWTVEPGETLPELYRQRAQQIRDRYDYIILWWSGGADSETVLQTFLKNDILIDELATFSNYYGSNDKQDFLNAEIFNVALPEIEQLKSQYSWIKHRVIDISQYTLDVFQDRDAKFDWIYYMNTFFTPNHIARDNIHLKIREWRELIDSGKKVCFLWGHDKPRLLHENNRFSVRFLDVIDSGPNVKSISGQMPYTDELFYWTPDLPKIVIKQAHLIKNYLNNNISTSQFISETSSDLAYKTHNNKKMWLSMDGVHNIIYPDWNISTFTVGKPPSIIASPRDAWFFNLEDTNTSKKIWQMGIKRLFKQIPDHWKNDPNNIHNGIKACVSKDYYLEK